MQKTVPYYCKGGLTPIKDLIMSPRITTLAVVATAIALSGCSKPGDAVDEAAKNNAATGVAAPSIEEVKAIA